MRALQRHIRRYGPPRLRAKVQAESFLRRLKTELLERSSFPKLEESRLELSHYIVYYNAERRHSALEYCSPNRF